LSDLKYRIRMKISLTLISLTDEILSKALDCHRWVIEHLYIAKSLFVDSDNISPQNFLALIFVAIFIPFDV
jgi:hypothetical protein